MVRVCVLLCFSVQYIIHVCERKKEDTPTPPQRPFLESLIHESFIKQIGLEQCILMQSEKECLLIPLAIEVVLVLPPVIYRFAGRSWRYSQLPFNNGWRFYVEKSVLYSNHELSKWPLRVIFCQWSNLHRLSKNRFVIVQSLPVLHAVWKCSLPIVSGREYFQVLSTCMW